jgi:hypothetical protein
MPAYCVAGSRHTAWGVAGNLARHLQAPLAQLAEQLTLNQWVPGSSPGGCTASDVVLRVMLDPCSIWVPDMPGRLGAASK